VVAVTGRDYSGWYVDGVGQEILNLIDHFSKVRSNGQWLDWKGQVERWSKFFGTGATSPLRPDGSV